MSQHFIRRNAGWNWPKRVWARIHEPRAVAIIQALIYLALGLGGTTAIIDAPNSLEGAIGEWSMSVLAWMIAGSCALGIPASLFGYQWLEQIIVWGVFGSALLYGGIIVGLQIGSTGNRLLQLSFVLAVALYQVIRHIRVSGQPFDRNLTPGDTISPAI